MCTTTTCRPDTAFKCMFPKRPGRAMCVEVKEDSVLGTDSTTVPPGPPVSPVPRPTLPDEGRRVWDGEDGQGSGTTGE